jgi:hypothetical protein
MQNLSKKRFDVEYSGSADADTNSDANANDYVSGGDSIRCGCLRGFTAASSTELRASRVYIYIYIYICVCVCVCRESIRAATMATFYSLVQRPESRRRRTKSANEMEEQSARACASY